MRHHFTKSERLALKVMAALHMEFTDIESGRIRKGKFERYDIGLQAREVRRVVSFKVMDRSFPSRVGVKVFLLGREVGPWGGIHPGARLTSWQIEKVMVGYECDDGRVEWKQRDIFPAYRIADDVSVLSTDA